MTFLAITPERAVAVPTGESHAGVASSCLFFRLFRRVKRKGSQRSRRSLLPPVLLSLVLLSPMLLSAMLLSLVSTPCVTIPCGTTPCVYSAVSSSPTRCALESAGACCFLAERWACENGRRCGASVKCVLHARTTGFCLYSSFPRRSCRFRRVFVPALKSVCLCFYLPFSVLTSLSISPFWGKWITGDMIREAAVGRNDVGVLKKK